MTVTIKDGLSTFGTQELVEIPNDKAGLIGGIASTNDSVQKAPLGILYRYKGNVYRYVLFDDGVGESQTAVASAAGGVAHWAAIDPENGTWTATSAYAATLGKNLIAGIFGGVVTQGYYTWIQVGGVATVFVADSTVAGDVCIYGGTDLYFGRIAADASITAKPFGVALEAKSNTTANKAATLLMGMIF